MAGTPLIGVLALQGGFEAHGRMLRKLGPTPPDVREVRVPGDLDGLDGLVIPGGESTTITLGIEREGLAEPLRRLVRGTEGTGAGEGEGSGRKDGGAGGIPVLGSCAGLIMLDRDHLNLMDIRAERNAFGRQLQSFEADIDVRGIDDDTATRGGGRAHGDATTRGGGRAHGDATTSAAPGRALRAVFIRAPWIAEHGPGVEILAVLDGHAVAAREGNMLAVAFHAELTDDDRIHRLFLDSVSLPVVTEGRCNRDRNET